MNAFLFKFIGVCVLITSFVAGWFMIDYRAFLNTPLIVPDEGVTININPGVSVRELADTLARQGLLEKPEYLVWLTRWEGATQKVMAGEYRIAPGTTPDLFLSLITQGKVKLYSFTIVEGWAFKQMMVAINDNENFTHTLQGLSPEEVMYRIEAPDEHPEGRFLPETYRFPRGTSDIDFLKRAYTAMEKKLQDEWAQRSANLPLETPYQALILASIIEKETARVDEYPKIAGVFIRRLQRGMRLQTDPTVIYGMGDAYKGNIRSRDLKSDTLYNTYTRKGLPPTPIAMPGERAIYATLHPAEGKELYFVSKGDGSHHFSETLEQHNQAVIKYQLAGKPKSFSSLPKPRAKNTKTTN